MNTGNEARKDRAKRITPVLMVLILMLSFLFILPVPASGAVDPHSVDGTVYKTGWNGTQANWTVAAATVQIQNLRTGEYLQTTSNATGIYSVDLINLPSGYLVGDLIKCTATNTTTSGSNSTAVLTGASQTVNITMGAGQGGIRFYTYDGETGLPLTDVYITIYDRYGARIITLKTEQYGLVDYSLDPGNYTLKARASNGTYNVTQMPFWITSKATTQTIAIKMMPEGVEEAAAGVPSWLLWAILGILAVLAVMMLLKPRGFSKKGEGSPTHGLILAVAMVSLLGASMAGCLDINIGDNPITGVADSDTDKPYMSALTNMGFKTTWGLKLTNRAFDASHDFQNNVYDAKYDLKAEWIRHDHSDVAKDSTYGDRAPDADSIRSTDYPTYIGDQGINNFTDYAVNNVWRDNKLLPTGRAISIPFYGTPKDVVKCWFDKSIHNLWTEIKSLSTIITITVPIEIEVKDLIRQRVIKSFILNLYIPFHIQRADKIVNDYNGERTKTATLDLTLFTPFLTALGQYITITPRNSLTRGYMEYSDDLKIWYGNPQSTNSMGIVTLCFGAGGYSAGQTPHYWSATGDKYVDWGFGRTYSTQDQQFPYSPILSDHSDNIYHAEI